MKTVTGILPPAEALFRVLESSWPAAAKYDRHGWIIREGRGGGKRVSAATAASPGGRRLPDIRTAEEEMNRLGQRPLFMIRQGDAGLDRALHDRGYGIVDPVTFYSGNPGELAVGEPNGPDAVFGDLPLAVQKRIWADGGVGSSRLAVMMRVRGPRAWILGRKDDRPAGTVFVAIHDGIAMVHALYVRPRFRGKGMGRQLMSAAAGWSCRRSARFLILAVTRDNAAAAKLYRSLGMIRVGDYHYRMMPG